jgi:lysophospholipase L1-like esterase
MFRQRQVIEMPVARALDGAEQVMVLQDGESRRAPTSAFIGAVSSVVGDVGDVSAAQIREALRLRLLSVCTAARAQNPRALGVSLTPPVLVVSTVATDGLSNLYTFGTAREGVFGVSGGYTEVFNVTFGRFRSTIVSGAPSSHSWRVECMIDAAVCDLRLMTVLTTQRFRIIVDGQYLDMAGVALTSALVRHMVRLDFTGTGGRRPRHVVIEGEGNALFEGVAVGPTESVYKVPGDRVRIYVQGDSFAASAMADRVWDGLGSVAADWFGARDCWVGAIGGTGWLNPGTGQTKFRDRNAPLIAAAPDIVLICGGHNDRTYPTADVTAEVAAWITTTRAALPRAVFVVMGAWPGDFGPSAEMIATENAIAAGVVAAADANTFFIPVSTDALQPWLFGTGNQAAPNGSGNTDVYIGTDTVHPTTAGHAMLGKRVAASMSLALGLPPIQFDGPSNEIYPQGGAMARTVDEYAFRRRFRAPDGGIQVQVDQVPLAVEYWRQGGGIAGAGAYMMAWSDANPTAQAVVVAKGTGFVTLGNGAGPLLEARDTGASKQVDAPVIVRGGATDYTTHPAVMAPNLRALWLGIDNRPLVRLSEDVSGNATQAGWRISASSTIAKLQAEGAAGNIGVFVAGKGTGNITLGNIENGNMLLVQPSLGASVNVPYIQPGTSGQPADIAMSPANGAPLRLGVLGRVSIGGGFARGGKLVRNAASGYGAVTIASTVSRVFIDGASTITSAEFTMPPSADLTDGQEISFTASQTVTTLTINANTAQTLVGAPATMGATSPFTLCFDSTTGKWTRV